MKHSIIAAMAASAVVLATGTAVMATPATADQESYGRNDAGGFRNVLPPGPSGVDTAAEFSSPSCGTGALPPHWADQQPLYEGLLYASPTLTDSADPATTTRTPRSGSRRATSSPRSAPGRA